MPWSPDLSPLKLLEMRAFLIFVAILTSSSFLRWDIQAEDLGQWKIREEFQELLIHPEKREEFLTRFGLVGLSEKVWWNLNKESLEFEAADIQAQSARAREIFSVRSYWLGGLFQSLAEIFSKIKSHPFDSASLAFLSFENLLLPAYLALLCLFLFQITLWTNPIRRDLFKNFGARKNLLVPLLILFSFLICRFANQNLLFIFFLSLVCLCYSRTKATYLSICLLIAFGLSTQSFFSDFQRTLKKEALLEALNEGRTRIEYEPELIQELGILDQATWAYWNQSNAEALELLNKSEPNWIRENLDVVIHQNPQNHEQSISRLENIRRERPGEEIILFNLSQLYLQTQDLVKAEEMRRALSPQRLQQLTNRAAESGRLVLTYSNTPSIWRGLKNSGLEAYSFLIPTHLTDVSAWIIYLLKTFFFLLPWILVGIAIRLRRRVSGLCQETGEATSSVEDYLSKLAQQVQQKSEDLDPQARQKFLHYHRFHLQKRESQIRRWSFIFPGVGWASEGKYILGFFVSLFIYWLLWAASPLWLQMFVHKIFGLPHLSKIFELGWSLSLLALGLFSFLFCRFLSLRRAS